MKLNVLIIEDEVRNATRLQSLLKEVDLEINVMAVLGSVADSIKWFNEDKIPDVILMDVRLSDGLCFEIFSACTITAPVIFTTAYDEYAIRAFKVNSIDYLLKPVHKAELDAALAKFMNLAVPTQSNPAIADLVHAIKQQGKSYRNRFLIPIRDGYKSIEADSIAYIYSEFKLTNLILVGGSQYSVPYSMDELEDQIDPGKFFRANRQYIINISSIEAIHNYFNGKLKITLKRSPDVEVLVSREKAPFFKLWLDT